MGRFVQIDYPQSHAGVDRVTNAYQYLRATGHSLARGRGTATFLLAAVVSALLVVANELVETWTEGHLMVAWVVLWAVGFASLALFAQPARTAGAAIRSAFRSWSAARKQAAEDDKLWNLALQDARVMADLSRAMSAAAERDLRSFY
ncbi:MAG: hypothetical protein HY854_20575 [Burkholderiales bacterium]|nr:hypothetical protein [Burkholderiales bacterium]